MSNPSLEIVKQAAKWVGIRESSKNQFTGMTVIWGATAYPDGWRNREPYCAAFVCLCVLRARQAMPDVFGGKRCTSASVAGWRLWSRSPQSGCYVFTADVWTPQPGDIVSFMPRLSHMGIVEKYDPRTGMVETIEGNTNDGGSREGDGFYRRKRRLDFCGEFYRVPW